MVERRIASSDLDPLPTSEARNIRRASSSVAGGLPPLVRSNNLPADFFGKYLSLI